MPPQPSSIGLPLERFGPQLGRPHVDTLKGSRHAKMKECYRQMITKADARFNTHLAQIEAEKEAQKKVQKKTQNRKKKKR